MKKGFVRLIVLIIAVSMMITACGTSNTGSNDKTAATTAATSQAAQSTVADDGKKMEGNMYLEGLPIVKEQETFSVFSDGPAIESLYYPPIFEKETNVKVNWMLYPYEIAKEKKNILINSGEYPDMIGGWLLSENEILTQGMGEGLYVPIDEAIQKYAPNITKALDMPGVRKTMTLPDGHVYTFPYVLGAPKVAFNPFINQKWLDAVGMKMPTTTDELLEVLRAFRDKDPNGNKKKDEIPFSGDKDNGFLGLFAGWFGTPCPKTGYSMINGQLTFVADTEAFKAAMKFFKQLNDEKLLDPEFFTQDTAQWKAKGNKNLYGVCIAYGSGDFAGEGLKPGEPTQFLPLPVLKGPNVEKPLWYKNTDGNDVIKTQLAVTNKAKNLPTIVRFWDYIYNEDLSAQLSAGPIGITCEKISNDQYKWIDNSKQTEEYRKKYEWGNLWPQSLPKFVTVKEWLPADGALPPFDDKKPTDKLYEPYLSEQVPQAWVGEADAKKISVIETDVQKYVQDKVAKWVSGQGNIDAEWDAYKAQLDKLGVKEAVAIRQKAIAALK